MQPFLTQASSPVVLPGADVSARAGGETRIRRSLNWKLGRVVIMAVGAALLIDLGFSLMRETQFWATQKQENLFGTAQILAATISKPVAAHDVSAIQNALRMVGRVPGLLYAVVEDTRRQEIASMGDAVRLGSDLTLARSGSISAYDLLTTRTIQIEVPVIESGSEVGTIRLVSDTRDLFGRFFDILSTALWSGLAAAVIGLLISLSLQRSVTRPLVRLTGAMAGVTRNHDYAHNLSVDSDDEIGALARNFNAMLVEIRAREREIVTKLVRAAEHRDTDTGEHVSRVAGYAELTARGLGLKPGDCELIGLASTMHDMGKIGVPDSILLKKGPLSAEERTEMERHAVVGYEILGESTSDLVRLAADIAFTHHERWDGKGYPRHLRAEEIPLAGRIVAVADVFDALTSERPYKKAWAPEKARAHIEENAGTHFDPACVEAFLLNWPEIERRLVGTMRSHSVAA